MSGMEDDGEPSAERDGMSGVEIRRRKEWNQGEVAERSVTTVDQGWVNGTRWMRGKRRGQRAADARPRSVT